MRERFNNYTLNRPRLRKIAGWSFVIIGFVAVIAPIVPGAPLMFVGFEILGVRMLLSDKIKRALRRKDRVSFPVESISEKSTT